MNQRDLKAILDLHRKWALGNAEGVRANLSGANLSDAYLSGANLSDAKVDPIREDFYKIMDAAKPEVVGLYKALLDGRINGQVYEGDCACLIGTIANVRGVRHAELSGTLQPDSSRPAEKWFLTISKGDTPENNPVAALTRDWLVEYMAANGIKAPTRKVVWEERA